MFLIGDAGESLSPERDPVYIALEKQASVTPARNVIVFLGDNLYPDGMPEENSPDRKISEHYIDEQVKIGAKSGALTIFIPGNHDWDNDNEDGLRRLKRQEDYIMSKNISNVMFLPSGGCPGPEAVDIGGSIRLILLDTQWWLRTEERPYGKSSDCKCKTEKDILDTLSALMEGNGGRHVIVAGHHPFVSNGIHGGFYNWKEHIFPLQKLVPWLWLPLPVVGSVYPLLRNSPQDLSNSMYENMSSKIRSVFNKYPPVVYAAGHEHAMQILKSNEDYVNVVSGIGVSSHFPSITTDDNTLFANVKAGYVRIDFYETGSVRLAVVEPVNRTGKTIEPFSMWLKKF